MTAFPEIETERLRLRNIEQKDAQSIFQYFSQQEVTKFYGMDSFKTIEDAENLIHSFQLGFQSNKMIRWGIALKDTDELIGTCGFHSISKKYKRAEVGYEVSNQQWGKGFVQEALKAIFTFGFQDMGFIRIGAVVMIENKPSRKVLEKLGFNEEGILRNYIIQNEIPYDVIMHSLLKEEWIKGSAH
ncbi:GNAT family N-acetyltransferase [Metabacillus idriensis]|uniref:GNAT family N-acetyltransferase n=1 Tax=Metabacillus idriensis TaxID=324768 RepID=UPI001748B1C5|nr:GNAT family protein [Metabacillus idriensis]